MPDDATDTTDDDELTNRPTPTDADFQRAMRQVREAVDGAGQAREFESRLANLEKLVASLQQGHSAMRSPLSASVFLARVDDADAWFEQAPTGSGTNVTLTDFVDGRSSDNKQLIPADTAAGTNRVVAVLQHRSGAGGLQFFELPAPGLRVVKLTVNAGVNGTDTTAPTYTYDLKSVTFDAAGTETAGATTLATNKTPKFGRPKGAVTGAAAYGLAQPSNDDGWVLIYAHEVADVGVC